MSEILSPLGALDLIPLSKSEAFKNKPAPFLKDANGRAVKT